MIANESANVCSVSMALILLYRKSSNESDKKVEKWELKI